MFSRTFKEVAEWYLDNMGILGLSWADQRVKYVAAKTLIKAFGGKVLSHGQIRKRERLDRMVIREWKLEMKKQGMSDATLQRYLSVGSVMLKTGWREKDWDLPNPFAGMIQGLKPTVRNRVLSEQEQAAIIMAMRQPYRDICSLILETAMRDGEVINLEWDRVGDGYIWFREGVPTREGGSKSGRDERVMLTDAAKAIIDRQPKGKYVFSRKGKRVRYPTFMKEWHDSRLRAGVEHCTPHDLRRTVGYNLRAAGVSLGSIKDFMRHSSTDITERVYAQTTPAMQEDVLRVLNQR